MSATTPGLVVSKREACRLLRVGYQTVEELIASGRLTVVRIGERDYISRASLEAIAGATAPAPAAVDATALNHLLADALERVAAQLRGAA